MKNFTKEKLLAASYKEISEVKFVKKIKERDNYYLYSIYLTTNHNVARFEFETPKMNISLEHDETYDINEVELVASNIFNGVYYGGFN